MTINLKEGDRVSLHSIKAGGDHACYAVRINSGSLQYIDERTAIEVGALIGKERVDVLAIKYEA